MRYKLDRGANWKTYWGVMPLPDGAIALGVVHGTGYIATGDLPVVRGALIRLANGSHVIGQAGDIRLHINPAWIDNYNTAD